MSKRTAMADVEVVEEEEEKSKKKGQRFDCAFLENLPFDSVMEMEILPRLPLKSVLLELASKTLSPLISDHLRRRYRLPNAASGLFFIFARTTTSSRSFYHALDSNLIVDGTLSALLPNALKFINDCCNGLILCQWTERGEVGTLVYNPLTGRSASIPNSSFCISDATLVFDPSISRHYKIIRFCRGNIHIFSSETGSWVQKKQAASHRPEREKGLPFFFNGKVYFPSYESPFVKIFDLQGRLVGRINLPHTEMGFTMNLPGHSNSEHFVRRLLGHSCGHLHFAVMVDDKMHVWILEDCDESRWVLKHSISLRCILDHAGLPTRDLVWIYPQVFHPYMGVVFIQVRHKMFSYNMDNGDFTEVCTSNGCRPVFVYSPCYSKDFDL